MDQDTDGLAARLAAYPHLQKALGPCWVEEQDRADLLDSAFPLARWLRLGGYGPDLAGLDRVLGRLADVPGIGSRGRRLGSDPPGFMETLTELYFGAWLLDRGYDFDWPSRGPDFAVHLGGGRPLLLEATTPRRAAWSDDLLVRPDLIRQRYGHSVEVEFASESLPDRGASKAVVEGVVAEAVAALRDAGAGRTGAAGEVIVQDRPDVGLRVVWTPDDHPRVVASCHPGPSSPWEGFRDVADAARKKARQLPEGEACGLVLGTRQMPTLAWTHFLEALRHNPEGDVPFDWSKLPGQVKYVVLYALVARQVAPFEAVALVNEDNLLPDPPGFADFVQTLFPAPFRAEPRP